MLAGFTSRIGERAASGLAGRILWSREVGIGRTLLALSTLGTLLATPTRYLMREPSFFGDWAVCSGPARVSVFCVFGSDPGLGRGVAILILVVVAAGWRPRFTALPHWWVAFSLHVTSTTADGGDAAAALLTLCLLPVALTDSRRWHWLGGPAPKGENVGSRELVAASGLIAVQLQVAVIYLHSAIAKFGVPEWANGTAAYYWLLNPRYGAPETLGGVMEALMTNSVLVVAVTYGVILVELALGFAWAFRGRLRQGAFAAGVALHIGIMFMMGLQSFGVAMFGALTLYLLASNDRGWPGVRVERSRRHPVRRLERRDEESQTVRRS